MSVRIDRDVVYLEGDCDLADAEPLVAALSEQAGRTVDLAQCQGIHGAVLQALLSLRPPVVGDPADAFLRDVVVSGVRRSLDGANGL
jgi:hypothetical protein